MSILRILAENMGNKVLTVYDLAIMTNIPETKVLRTINDNPLLFEIIIKPLDDNTPQMRSVSYKISEWMYNLLIIQEQS